MWFHSWALTLCGNTEADSVSGSTSSHREKATGLIPTSSSCASTFDLQLAASGLSACLRAGERVRRQKRLKRVSVLYLCVLSDITEAQL